MKYNILIPTTKFCMDDLEQDYRIFIGYAQSK